MSQLSEQLFLVGIKLPSNRRKGQINNLLRLKKINEVKTNQKEINMGKIEINYERES